LSCTGLAPEHVRFDPELGFSVEEGSLQNHLRPEAVESMYYMWRLTGERKYRVWAWAVFQAFQRHSKGTVGYHSLKVPLLHGLPLSASQIC
jgi:mannosyl-oligosaccharide alpha-1,2-mannosidase